MKNYFKAPSAISWAFSPTFFNPTDLSCSENRTLFGTFFQLSHSGRARWLMNFVSQFYKEMISVSKQTKNEIEIIHHACIEAQIYTNELFNHEKEKAATRISDILESHQHPFERFLFIRKLAYVLVEGFLSKDGEYRHNGDAMTGLFFDEFLWLALPLDRSQP